MTANDLEHEEQGLLTAWRGGDSRAGKHLFTRHAEAVTRFFASKVSDQTQVADLVHRTFMTLQRSTSAVTHSVRSFMFGVARNELRHYVHGKLVESQRRDRLQVARDAGDVTAHDIDPRDPELELGDRQERRLVAKTLRRLSLDDQVLLELTYWESVPRSELAGIFGVPEATMASRIRLARRRFELKLRELSGALDLLETTSKTIDTWRAELGAHVGVMQRQQADKAAGNRTARRVDGR
jgi:RNA polymerase sigma factor (sigma-70 family)